MGLDFYSSDSLANQKREIKITPRTVVQVPISLKPGQQTQQGDLLNYIKSTDVQSKSQSLPRKDLFGSNVAQYATSQSALAAWLYLQGHEIIQVDSSNPNKRSIIFKSTPKLRSDVQLWQIGQAEGNCSQYESARKAILEMIHNE